MSVIVKTSYDIASQYRGKCVSTSVGGKKHNVYFRVTLDDFTLEDALQGSDDNIVMYEYQGMVSNPVYRNIENTSLYIVEYREVCNDISEDDIKTILEEVPDGVTPVIKLPTEYNDFEFICRMCDKYPRVRFCGGTLFCAVGCRIGCCGHDILERHGVKFKDKKYIKEGCACGLPVISDEGLTFTVSDKRTKSTRTKKSGGSSKSKPKKKSFNDMFGSTSVAL